MKKNITSTFFLHLLVLSLVFSMITGCNITDSRIQKELDTVPPIIKHVQSGKIVNDEYIATTSLRVGDVVNFVISTKGPSNKIIKIHLTEYYPANANQAHTEFKPIDAVLRSKKTKGIMLKKPINFLGPPGERKFEIRVEDAENNLSNVYTLHLMIH
ncbi:MAG: hypothetical protein JRF40_04465 [Deltaproteobacteria bacterium]|nr:hypothetical protein [Deltaproteobacteria bacterium]